MIDMVKTKNLNIENVYFFCFQKDLSVFQDTGIAQVIEIGVYNIENQTSFDKWF